MADDPMQFIREARDTGEVYAAAYGYLQALVDEYIQGVATFQSLATDYVTLQTAAAQELERIMAIHRARVEENMKEHATVTVTSDPDLAKAIQEADPASIILDAR